MRYRCFTTSPSRTTWMSSPSRKNALFGPWFAALTNPKNLNGGGGGGGGGAGLGGSCFGGGGSGPYPQGRFANGFGTPGFPAPATNVFGSGGGAPNSNRLR